MKSRRGGKLEFQGDKKWTQNQTTVSVLVFPLLTHEDNSSTVTVWKMFGKHVTLCLVSEKLLLCWIKLFNHVSGNPFKNTFCCSFLMVIKFNVLDLFVVLQKSVNQNCMISISKRFFTIKYVVKQINLVAHILTDCNKVF